MARLTSSQLRQRNAGYAILAACALGTAGLLFGAYKVDQSNGITVAESLASVGIGQRPASWRLLAEHGSGNVYVVDYGLSSDDCGAFATASAKAQPAFEFICERER